MSQETRSQISDSSLGLFSVFLAALVAGSVLLALIVWAYWSQQMYRYDIHAPFSGDAIITHIAIVFLSVLVVVLAIMVGQLALYGDDVFD